MNIRIAREVAARVWCDQIMCKEEMDGQLAEQIAQLIFNKYRDRVPLLGLATTGELIEELKARFEIHCDEGLDYKTYNPERDECEQCRTL